jgi:hypothetical protein
MSHQWRNQFLAGNAHTPGLNFCHKGFNSVGAQAHPQSFATHSSTSGAGVPQLVGRGRAKSPYRD